VGKAANGEGSVKQRGKSWQARWHDPDGVRRSRTFPTRDAASRWVAAQRTDVDRGDWVPPDPGTETVAAFVLRWITDSTPRVKVSTVAAYKQRHRLYIAKQLDVVTVAKCDPATLRAWHARISKETSPHAAAGAYALVRAAFAQAVTDGVVKVSPCRGRMGKATPAAPREVRVVTPGEVARVVAELPDHYRALALVLAWGGLRSGEAFALRPENVAGEAVRIVATRGRLAGGGAYTGPPKSAAGVRTVILPKSVADRLAEHMKRYPGPLVFATRRGSPVTSHLLRQALHRAAAQAGVVPFNPHALRATAATVATQNGATLREVMAQLGHTTPTTALAYQRATDERAAALAAAADEVIRSAANVVPLRPRLALVTEQAEQGGAEQVEQGAAADGGQADDLAG
jgi:integrase